MKQKIYNITHKYLLILILTILSNSILAQSFEDVTVDALAPTPVKLISFSATNFNNDILVNWETSIEINNSHFVIERSTDGVDFRSVGQVAGKNNSNINIAYNFLDINTPNINLYYRLKQVDFDGTSTLSDIVKVNANKKSNTISIFPNPITERKIVINISNLPKDNYEINIFSIDGKKVYSTTRNFNLESALLCLQIPESIKSGNYLLQIINLKGKINLLHKIVLQ